MSLGAQKPTATKMNLMPHNWECNHLLGGKCKPSFGGKGGYSSEDECNKACAALPPAPSPASYDPVWVCPSDTADPGMPSCVEVDKKSGVSKGQPYFKSRQECNSKTACKSSATIAPIGPIIPVFPKTIYQCKRADGYPELEPICDPKGKEVARDYKLKASEYNSFKECQAAYDAGSCMAAPPQPSGSSAVPLCSVIDPKTNKETKQYCAAQALVCGFNALDPSKMTTLDKKRAASDTCVVATLFMADAWESS